jgi:hypothetical protein
MSILKDIGKVIEHEAEPVAKYIPRALPDVELSSQVLESIRNKTAIRTRVEANIQRSQAIRAGKQIAKYPEPLTVYHGLSEGYHMGHPESLRKYGGIHVGSLESAQDRLTATHVYTRGGGGLIHKFQMDSNRILGMDNPWADKELNDLVYDPKRLKEISKHHDAIAYINEVEGRGDVSYLVLNPNILHGQEFTGNITHANIRGGEALTLPRNLAEIRDEPETAFRREKMQQRRRQARRARRHSSARNGLPVRGGGTPRMPNTAQRALNLALDYD